MSQIVVSGITEDNIRVAKWKLKQGHTKKDVCSFLNIAYNTTRLAKIIAEFDEKVIRQEELKKQARANPISESTKLGILKDYSEGMSVAKIADQLYLTPTRIKKVLLEAQVPIRGRGKFDVKVDHIIQDLEIPFKVGDRVFVKPENINGVVKRVYDEAYIETLKNGRERYIENPHVRPKNEFENEREGIHYFVYWVIDGVGEFTSRDVVSNLINKINYNLEKYGREYYEVHVEKKYQSADGELGYEGYFCTAQRSDLFGVR